MSRPVVVVGEPSQVRCHVAEEGEQDDGERLTLVLGDHAVDHPAVVRWGTDGGRHVDGVLTHTAPWPAADDLFELPEPDDGTILVVGPPERADIIVEALRTRALGEVVHVPFLARGELERARIVVAALEPTVALVTVAMPVLAARRLLVTPSRPGPFGLLAGIDHLAYETPGEAVQFVDAAAGWDAFDMMRAAGVEAALPHRAGIVLERVRLDLELLARVGA